MRIGPETLFVFLAVASAGAVPPPPQERPSPTPAASPSPSAAASPSPTPRYRFAPYGFERMKEATVVPLLRFEDKEEVRSLEMNEAIARFFDKGDEGNNMLRGATPGGAPTIGGMAPYRPHATQGMNFLGAAIAAGKAVKQQIDLHKGMEPADPAPSPTPGLSPSPTVRFK